MNDSEIIECWKRLLENEYRGKISSAIFSGDNREIEASLDIELSDIYEFETADPHQFYQDLIKNPSHVLALGYRPLNDIIDDEIQMTDPNMDTLKTKSIFTFNLVNPGGNVSVDADLDIGIKQLLRVKIDRVVSFTGSIKKTLPAKYRALKAGYQCQRCKIVQVVKQKFLKEVKPQSCDKDQGGCGRAKSSTKFLRETSADISTRTQVIVLREPLEEVDPERSPAEIVTHLDGPLCNRFHPGKKVRVTGILSPEVKGKKPIYPFYFRIFGIEKVEDNDFAEPEAIEKINEVTQSGKALQTLTDLFAPAIEGEEEIKQAIILQLLGSPREYNRRTGEALRGDIHILLIGDPGTAKSDILRFAAKCIPKSQFVSCAGATAVGITAAAARDENDGQWYLEAGPLAMANGGLVSLDELSRMSEDGEKSLLEAMEQQWVTVNKANIHTSLPTRTSILAACNPYYGKFIGSKDISEQVVGKAKGKLSEPTIDRFDLIFIMRDEPDGDRDEDISSHILEYWYSENENNQDLDVNFLRSYITEARQIDPKLDPKLFGEIKKIYFEGRENYRGYSLVPVDPRHLHTIVRLSRASARSRLSEIVEQDDVELAVSILMKCIKTSAPEGLVRPGVVDTDVSDCLETIKSTIYKMMNLDDEYKANGVPRVELLSTVTDWDRVTVEKGLDKLSRDGEIYEIGRGRYIPVN